MESRYVASVPAFNRAGKSLLSGLNDTPTTPDAQNALAKSNARAVFMRRLAKRRSKRNEL